MTVRRRSSAGRSVRGLVRVARWILNAAAALGVAVVLVALIGFLFGVRPVIFVSGSMSPAIGSGSLALTVPVSATDIAVGDVVTTPRAKDGVLVTHRVASIERDAESGRWYMHMQGDANKAADSETYDVTAGAARVVWHAEGWGRAVAALDSLWVAAAAVALVIIAAWPSRRRSRDVHEETPVSAAEAATDRAVGAR
ncbi:MAG: signal peptidase I [Microbacterium sp.]|nr:MAG: signal peptidase I [Microbacterium sp.]